MLGRIQLFAAVVFASNSQLRVGRAEPAQPASELPPGSWVSPEAVERFRVAVDARARGEEASAPDKREDQWTSSQALRRDLAEQLSGFADNFTVLEVGSYFGYTTRLLSDHFSRVIALDAVPQFLQANREYNLDRNNILYLKFNTIDDDWGVFSLNTIHVVFLDASHDVETVLLDVANCLRLPTVSLIIFDDYGAEEGVRAAVHEFVARGRLRPVAFLGEGADGRPWRLRDGREVPHREAIACEVVRDWQQPAAEAASGAPQPPPGSDGDAEALPPLALPQPAAEAASGAPQPPPDSGGDAEELPPFALPGAGDATAATGSEQIQIVVDGTSVKMDKLGPVVVNKDGSISRINNWHDMIESEQQSTLRIVGKRNQERLAKLQNEGVDTTVKSRAAAPPSS